VRVHVHVHVHDLRVLQTHITPYLATEGWTLIPLGVEFGGQFWGSSFELVSMQKEASDSHPLTSILNILSLSQGWFYDRPFEDIARDDVKEFLAWGEAI
jgi:hypothetical protein